MAAGKVVVYSGGKLTKTGSGENATIDGNLVVTGNLSVTGASTTVNVEDLNVEQGEITLNYAAASDTSGSANGSGIRIQDAVDASTDATMLWNNASSGSFDFSHGLDVTGNITVSGTVDGVDIANLNTTVGGILSATTANVAGAGAAMDSDFTNAGFMKRGANSGEYSTVASIAYEDILSNDVDTDFSDGVSANHDTLASAKAIKDYVDNQVGGATLTAGSNISINGSSIDLDDNISLGQGGSIDADTLSAKQAVLTNIVAVSLDVGGSLSLGRAVAVTGNGSVEHADNTSTSKDMVIGIVIDDGENNRAANGYSTGSGTFDPNAEPADTPDGDDFASGGKGVPLAVAGSIVTAHINGTKTLGAEVYLTTAGELHVDAPTSGAVVRVGYIIDTSTNQILVQPQFIMDN